MVDSSLSSSNSTPVPPRAPPSPASAHNPNFLNNSSLAHYRSPKASPAASAISSSPASSSVSFTLAPVSPSITSLSLSPFTISSSARFNALTSTTTLSQPDTIVSVMGNSSTSEPEAQTQFSNDYSPCSSSNSGTEAGEILEDPHTKSQSEIPPPRTSPPLAHAGKGGKTLTAAASLSVDKVTSMESLPSIPRLEPLLSSPSVPDEHDSSTPVPSAMLNSQPPKLSSIHQGLGDYDDSPSPLVATGEDGSVRTPNVYINGLPPHYPEDQLFELTSAFGTIRSVRSFTRHIGERESGYGFVLFETIEAAEACIMSLRRFRNLHPTFSKQVHKIPGTPYAHMQTETDGASTTSGPESEGQHFKNKMERLQDPNSTNLYLEGLPLSIDDSSLAALVSPHRIKSSRLFQTRLSNPPRIIAFVRLETRAGAEEVVERLHGRMVRGWNDPGSRISVRFADTAEQRELRRVDRSTRDGDQSPARLTIAQAALLNLRGREQLSPQIGSSSLPTSATASSLSSFHTAHSGDGLSTYDSARSNLHQEFASNHHNPDVYKSHIARSGGPVHLTSHARYAGQTPSSQPPLNGFDMSSLVESLRKSAPTYEARSGALGHQPSSLAASIPASSRSSQVLGDLNLNLNHANPSAVRALPVLTQGNTVQARGGFTPTEEYILQAHTQATGAIPVRGHSVESLGDVDYNLGMRGYRTQASTVSLNQRSQPKLLPEIAEQDVGFRTVGSRPRRGSTASRGSLRERDGVASSHMSLSPNLALEHPQYGHNRSSTLPQLPSLAQNNHPQMSQGILRHQQHNSMNIPANILRNQSQPMPKHRLSGTTINENTAIHLPTDSRARSMYINESSTYSSDKSRMNNPGVHQTKFQDRPTASTYRSAYPGPDVYKVEQSSPPMVSPALTYSSRGSGATMSPATPFIGHFPQDAGIDLE